MKKLLFLDFDGVLHPTTTNHSSEFFSKNQLLEETLLFGKCEVVISSSWRFHYSLELLLKNLPLNLSQIVTGITGNPHIGNYSRYNEILNYLREKDLVDVDWMSLDDSYYEFPPNCPNLIRCNPNTGLTINECILLKNWLSK